MSEYKKAFSQLKESKYISISFSENDDWYELDEKHLDTIKKSLLIADKLMKEPDLDMYLTICKAANLDCDTPYELWNAIREQILTDKKDVSIFKKVIVKKEKK